MDAAEKTRRLAYFDTEEIVLSDEQSAPTAVRVAKFGENTYVKHCGDQAGTRSKFSMTPADADAVIAEFSSRGKDMVVDYEHQTLSGKEAPAAGWASSLEKREDGLYAVMKEWTDKAKTYFKDHEYRYFSPVWKLSRTTKSASAIHSLALTNHPGLDFAPAAFADDVPTDEELDANKNEAQSMDKLLELLGLLKLDDDADKDTEIENAVQALIDGRTAQGEFLTLHDCEDLAGVSAKIADMVPAEEKAELQTKLVKQEAEKAVELVLSDGKICEAQKDGALAFAEKDIESFNALYANAPKLVPLNDNTDTETPEAGDKPIVLTPEQQHVAKMTGVSEEDFIAELEKK